VDPRDKPGEDGGGWITVAGDDDPAPVAGK
jgi:hypothetical protein